MQEAQCYLLGRLKSEERPAVLFNTVISSCLYHKRHELAEQCLRAMDNAGVDRDAVTWALVLKMQVV